MEEYMEFLHGNSQIILDNKQEIDAIELGKEQVTKAIRKTTKLQDLVEYK